MLWVNIQGFIQGGETWDILSKHYLHNLLDEWSVLARIYICTIKCPRINLRALVSKKFSWGNMPPDPPRCWVFPPNLKSCMNPWYIILYCMLWVNILYYIMLWVNILYYIMLWVNILYYIMLWVNILYYIMLWVNILYYTVCYEYDLCSQKKKYIYINLD